MGHHRPVTAENPRTEDDATAMPMPRRVEQRAEFVLASLDDSGDFDPDQVSLLVGIAATATARRGEVLSSGHTRRWSSWTWATPVLVNTDSEDLVRQLLDRVEAARDELIEARQRWRLGAQINLVVYMYGVIEVDDDATPWADVSTPGLHFTSETVRRIAGLDASIDIDSYIIAVPS
jgi:hypothetical protein